MKKATSSKVSQKHQKRFWTEGQMNEARTRKKVKIFNTRGGGGGGGTILTVGGCSRKKLNELEKVSAKVEKASLSQNG